MHEPEVVPRSAEKGSTQITITQQEFSGPLPHPDILARYESVVPGAAQRIIRMAEVQQGHRIQSERRGLVGMIARTLLGQIFGLLIGLSGIGGAVYVAVKGPTIVGPLFGAFLGGGTLYSLVKVFIVGSQQESIEPKSEPKQ